MITNIQIEINSTIQIDEGIIEIFINNLKVNFKVINNSIVINEDIQFGFHQLKIIPLKIDENFKIEFTSVQIGGASLRQCLYLSYCDRDGSIENTTILNDYHSNWNLPFGNPVSWWLSECATKIHNTMYGKNLSDTLEIHYPESVKINDTYPTIVQDFFKYNFGFYSYNKDLKNNPLNNIKIPYIKINLDYNEQELFYEFNKNINLISNNGYIPKQNAYNLKESNLPVWEVYQTSIGDTQKYDPNIFPCYAKLLKFIESQGAVIGVSFIALSKPDSYAAPHIDDYYKQYDFLSDQIGCCKIWIPIGWEDGNYFKLDKVGLIPHNQGAYMFNANQFVHASVNQSNKHRFTIGVNCKFTNNNFVKYIVK